MRPRRRGGPEIDLAADLVACGWRRKVLDARAPETAAVAVAALLVEEEGLAGVDLADAERRRQAQCCSEARSEREPRTAPIGATQSAP